MERSKLNIDWPIEYKNELLVGNLSKSVALCSLWSDKGFVADKILDEVVVIGNLYSHGPGIEGIIRNILVNPSITTLVLAGKDKSNSGDTLLNLFNEGVEETQYGWTIPLPNSISSENLLRGARSLDREIPQSAIEQLRREVEIIDLRGNDWDKVLEVVKRCEVKPPFAEGVIYPKSSSSIDVLKGEDVGFLFRGNRPEKVWLNILRTVRQFGSTGESQWTTGAQELLNIVSVLKGNLDKMMSWPSWVGLSRRDVAGYAQQLIEGTFVDKEDSYAYGQRMRIHKGDQIKFLIEQLNTQPYSRSMIIDLWSVKKDWFGRPDNPPCLVNVWFRVFDNKLTATYLYRSHDIFNAWFKNAMGDRLHQAWVANEAGLELGATTVISESAHIYNNVLLQVDHLLSEQKPSWKFTEDPRGNFVIYLENDKICVNHHNRSGAITKVQGVKAELLYKELCLGGLISRLDHAAYIGYELARAERSLKDKTNYVQGVA